MTVNQPLPNGLVDWSKGPAPIPKYPDGLRIAGRLFRAGLADHDYSIGPDGVFLTREGIERLLLLAEKIPCIQKSLNA